MWIFAFWWERQRVSKYVSKIEMARQKGIRATEERNQERMGTQGMGRPGKEGCEQDVKLLRE